MAKRQNLQPTLWRTCRALANRTRLKILQELLLRPDQTVGQIAARLRLTQSVASLYLRALNARGLLQAGREGPSVRYCVAPNVSISGCAGLVKTLRYVFNHHHRPVELIFRQATAFTHPRRIAIIQRLQSRPMLFMDIRMATGISSQAMSRHLKKLMDRGFVANPALRLYCSVTPGDRFSRELLHLIRKGLFAEPRHRQC